MSLKELPIGLFDSGVGGISVLLEAQELLPQEDFLYLADQKNFPYGEKTGKEIKKLALENVGFLLKKGCKLVVIACNTATIQAISLLRKKFPQTPFVGVVPVVKPASRETKTGHLAILSTTSTSKSRFFWQLMDQYASKRTVYNLTCPGLVELIEKGILEGEAVISKLKICLAPALEDPLVDIFASGCTHFPLIRESVLKVAGRKIRFITPDRPVARQVKNILEKRGLKVEKKKKGKVVFFTTADPRAFSKVATRLLGTKVVSKKVSL